jgi:GTP diphosphokinase / guanosine-3',5'-bis(diphosphate) 3'-diphosphatase
MMEWRSAVSDAQEFVEGMKRDILQNRVYVFTPRGDIIDLISGSTLVDFAYQVYTTMQKTRMVHFFTLLASG